MIEQADHTLAEARTYKIVPLRESHSDDARMLSAILRGEHEAVKDPGRTGFYWIDGDRSVYYINVHDAARTVYLVNVAYA